MLRLSNLAGAFTGTGFARKHGRLPTIEDCAYLNGPIDICCSPDTGLIQSITPHDSYDSTNEAEVLDAAGLIATAGFVDSHTHALFAGTRATEFFLRWNGATYREISDSGGGIHSTVKNTNRCDDSTLVALLQGRLQRMLSLGTTTVEVKSGYAASPQGERRLLRLVQVAAKSQLKLPEVVPTFLGLHTLPPGCVEHDYCDAMIAILKDLRVDNLAHFADAFPERGFFSCGESMRFLAAAADCGLGVKVHADEITNLGASKRAILMRAASIDHLEHIDAEAISMLGDSPTVATVLPATSFFLGIQYANARRLIDAGARVALATDFNPGSAPAHDLQFTMLLAASQLNMTPSEILCATTYNGAAALCLERSHGVLEQGRVANIVLWKSHKSMPDAPDSLLEEMCVERLTPRVVVVKGRLSQSS